MRLTADWLTDELLDRWQRERPCSISAADQRIFRLAIKNCLSNIQCHYDCAKNLVDLGGWFVGDNPAAWAARRHQVEWVALRVKDAVMRGDQVDVEELFAVLRDVERHFIHVGVGHATRRQQQQRQAVA